FADPRLEPRDPSRRRTSAAARAARGVREGRRRVLLALLTAALDHVPRDLAGRRRTLAQPQRVERLVDHDARGVAGIRALPPRELRRANVDGAASGRGPGHHALRLARFRAAP